MEYQTHSSAQNGQTTDTSGLAKVSDLGARYEVGRGSIEMTTGYGMTAQRGQEYTIKPEVDPLTGLTFTTAAGLPVSNGQPRMTDLVDVGGFKVQVGQAIRDGLIPNPFKLGDAQRPQVATAQLSSDAVDGPAMVNPEGEPSLADTFTADVLPRVSPATTNSIMADMMAGQFSEKTMDYLQLEGGMSAQGLEGVRDAFAGKVTAATGMDEGELADLWKSDRKAFSQAVSEMMKTGSTSAFQSLAAQADAAAYVPLSNDAAMDAWRSADFPQALMDAGLEPIFDGGVVSINIPGRGVVSWIDAVSQGLVKVSRA
ncbi:hypothetical protein [Yoonia algicola]|uniref:Uncharacterized protein n=1 Tax=Yoonia algicola TaxID=3137368 RepID=A0AAN0MAR5_9RHOB